MKKRRLFTIGLLAVGLTFTACNDDDDEDFTPVAGPSLSVIELNTNNTDGGDFTISQGDALEFAIEAAEGAANMDEFEITVTGANSISSIPSSSEGNDFPLNLTGDDEEFYQDTVSFFTAGTTVGVTNYTFTVSDDNGALTSISYDVTVEAIDNLVVNMFTWNRVGSNPGTGLEQFGLEWTQNTTTNAIVTQDEATIFVTLDEAVWDSVETQNELTTVITNAADAGASIDQYTEVSSQDDLDYNDYLGVIYNDEPYILNIQEGTVAINSQNQADITITGFYKN